MIKTESLVKTYKMGNTVIRALDGVSLTVEKGEMLAITGASGSGKSTIMHIIGCLDHPDSGTYLLAGEDVSKLSTNRLAEIRNRRIGFVFQTFNLLSRVSALENVGLPLLYAGSRSPGKRAKEALETVNLLDRMRHEPSQLSGGQRQRVAVARAIVNNPDVILADEPTGNLDSKTSVEIMDLFKELNRQGRTVLIVTHEADVAAYCNRAVHMVDGRIVENKETSGV